MNLTQQEKMLSIKEKHWEREKEIIKRKRNLKEEQKEIRHPRKKISTTKLLIAFLFLNCTAIEIFTGWATVQSFVLAKTLGFSVDFTPLVTLISAVVGEVIGYAIYSIKSTKENTKGGIVYESALREQEYTNNNDTVG